MTQPALEFHKLSVSYGKNPVLRSLSLTIPAGACVGLVGESGCGKSTAAYAALRALPPAGRITAGTITIDGERVTALPAAELRRLRATRVSMVYQDPSRALNPTLTIGAQLTEVFDLLGATGPEAIDRAKTMLGRVRFPSPARIMAAYPHQLSGGMQQRVVIAMALAKNPALLILDEPTTGLDATVEAEILDLVDKLRQDTRTAVLLISHNLPMVGRMCDRIGVLYAGTLVEEGPASEVLRAARHPYTASLIHCMPASGRRKQDGALATISGQLPSPGQATEACVFAPRCARAEPICRATAPPANRAGTHLAYCHFAPPFPIEAPEAASPHIQAAPGETPLLSVRNLTKTYPTPSGIVRAVTDISFTMHDGEILGLVGESGSGKTTLAKLLLGLVAPDPGGSIALHGAPLAPLLKTRPRRHRQALQIIFQNPDSALNRAHRIRHILSRPLSRLSRLAGPALETRLQSLAAAVRLGQAHLAMRPRALSGGLKQRVAIARAFAGEPKIVICDEPTSALDVSIQAAILNLLAGLQREKNVGYIFISHDLAVIRYLADRIAVLYLGRILEIGPAAAVFSGPHHPYTAALLSAAPSLQGDNPDRIRLTGEIPNPAAIPPGCVFQNRCPQKIGPICETTEPELPFGEIHAIRCHLPQAQMPKAPPL